jgi:pimeloyl-ACP methyl ester carboxylesterase
VSCYCAKIPTLVVAGVALDRLRCPDCVDAIVESKNELVRENQRLLRGEFTEEEFQNLCHNLPEDCPEKFAEGCLAYNRKLFGDKSGLQRKEAVE